MGDQQDSYETHDILKQVFLNIIPILIELEKITEDLRESERKVEFYRNLLEPIEGPFMRLVLRSKQGSQSIDLKSAIRFFGVRNCRDFFYAKTISEILDPKGFQWDQQSGSLKVPLAQTMKFANSALITFGEDSRYQDFSYRGGALFDVLTLLNFKFSEERIKVKSFIDECHKDAVRVGLSAMKFAKEDGKVKDDPNVVTTAFVISAAQAMLGLFDPRYIGLKKRMNTQELPLRFCQLIERKLMGVTHNMIAAALIPFIPGFKESFWPSLTYEFPFYNSRFKDPSAHQLANLIHRAVSSRAG